MNSTLSVSVIVTAYKQVDTIGQTLDSIISQECKFPFEIIIGEDFSNDGTRDVCLEYEKRYPVIVKPLFHEENMGVAANLALCITKAKGKYIAFCAADDFWHNPAKLQLQIDFLEKNLDYGVLYTDYDKLNINTGKTTKNYLKTSHKTIYEGDGLITSLFRGKVPILTLTVMLRKELFDKYVPADDYIKYRFPLEDWPTWLILSKYTKLGYLPISTATYRSGHESISNPWFYEKIEKRFSQEQIMYKYLCDRFPKDLSYSETGYRSYAKGVLLNLAYKKFDYPAAKKYAQQMCELGSNQPRVKMARYWITFKVFAILKWFRQKLND